MVLVGAGCQDSGTIVGLKEVKDLVVPELEITDFRPPDGEMNVAPDAVLAVSFSEPVRSESIGTDSIQLQYINPDLDPAQTEIHYEWALLDDGRSLEIKPVGNLLDGETVSVLLTCDFQSDDEQTLTPASEAFLDNVCYTSEFTVAE